MYKVLVIAAHADDEVIGCGGTIAKHVDTGDVVKLAVVTRATSDRYGKEVQPTERRQQEAKSAASVLGIDSVFFGYFPEVRLDHFSMPDIVNFIQTCADDIDIVYIPHWGDLHQDHRIVSEAAHIAFRPECSHVLSILAYTVAPMAWSGSSKFSPNVFIDISKTLDKKMLALSQYKKEIRQYPHPRSEEFLIAQASFYGAKFGYSKAEAFELVWDRR